MPRTHEVAAPGWAWVAGSPEKGLGGGRVWTEQSLPKTMPRPLPSAERLTVVGKISFNPKDVLGRGAGGTFVFR